MKKIWVYHITVFLSAFLLFQVQPIFSKALLPGFGGSYLVWGACMVFFQGMLLSGYWYAHSVQKRFGVISYSRVHWLLLLSAFFFFPFDFTSLSTHSDVMSLSPAVSVALAAAVSLPFFCLSTTSLVLQEWLATSSLSERKNPYVLYSASNLGSMLALLSYPVLVEPFLDLRQQGLIWWAGYALMLCLHFFCMPRKGISNFKFQISEVDDRSQISEKEESDLEGVGQGGCRARGTIGVREKIIWFMLSVSACSVLLDVTNIITLEISSLPLLWILPLSVYLF